MDSRFVLRCAMSMNLVQFQSKLSVPNIFQQFGIEAAGTVIVDRALRVQSLSCSYYSDTASRLVFAMSFNAVPASLITRNSASARLFVEDLIISSRTDARLCPNEAFN